MATDKPIVEKHSLTIDEALIYFGEYRQFQWLLDASLCVMSFPRVFQVLIMTFATVDPPWRCTENSTICLYNGTMSSSNKDRCHMPRNEWQYTEPAHYSIASQFNLQCENEWKMHLLTSVVFLGWGLGAIVLGYLADNFGRKVVIYPSQAAVIFIGFLCSFFQDITLIILARFLIGFCIPGATVQSFILVSEYVGPRRRPIAGLLIFVSFSVSMCVLALKAYLIRNWKHLSVACTIPYALCLVTYFFVPESIRWLRLRRGKNELMSTFRRIAYWNKVDMPDDFIIVQPAERISRQQSSSIRSIFHTRRIMMITLINGYTWAVNGMVYYGLVLAAGNLGGSVYLNFFLLSVVGIPSNLLAIDLLERIGRKKTVIGSMAIASVFCICVAFVPLDTNAGKICRIAFAVTGMLFIGISFAGIYVWSLEIYPTSMRANGLGFLQVTTRVGAATAPWVAKGLVHVSAGSPFIVMGASSLIAAILLLFLPDTKGKPTLETDEDLHEKRIRLVQSTSVSARASRR